MKNVQDIYPLSPMQQAMLLHAIARPLDNSLVNQFVYELRGPLAIDQFRSAWQAVINRHPALRTAFVWGGKAGPLQVVRKLAEIEFSEFDWSMHPAEKRAGMWEELLASDQSSSLDLQRAPLMRYTVVRIAEQDWRMIWTSHHLVVDRWCVATLWKDALTAYQSLVNGKEAVLPRAAPYRSYIGWLQQQPAAAAEEFWRDYLAGFESPTTLTRKMTRSAEENQQIVRHHVGNDELDRLRKYAQQCGVTFNVAIQVGLALAIHRLTGQPDVLFGITVSGRPSDLSGVDQIVGTFVGNVPVRLELESTAEIELVMRAFQTLQQRRSSFDYLSQAEVHACADLTAGQNLFDTILVNLASIDMPMSEQPEVIPRAGSLKTAVPLTISIESDHHGIEVRAMVSKGYEPVVELQSLLEAFADSLVSLSSAQPNTVFSELSDFRGYPKAKAVRAPRVVGQFDAEKMEKTVEGRGEGREAVAADVMLELVNDAWQEVLDEAPAGLLANFFESGGDSLRAVRFHQRIEQLLRVRVPLLALFQDPTPARMAALLSAGDWPAIAASAIPVRRGNFSLPPLFMIASPEVNTVGYAMLARHLEPGRAAWVIQEPPEPGGIRRLHPAVLPDMARRYVEEVRRVHPNGPYLLLGMCTGAHIAQSMAIQLQEQGQVVAFVGVINTWAHYTVAPIYRMTRRINKLHYYCRRVSEISREPAREWLTFLKKRFIARIPAESRGATASQSTEYDSSVDQTVDVEQADANWDPWIEDFGWRHKDPGVSGYAGTITVLRIQPQRYWRTGERDLGWGRHAMLTDVIDLPGSDHHRILREPQVRDVAQRLRGYWDGTGNSLGKKENSGDDCDFSDPLKITD